MDADKNGKLDLWDSEEDIFYSSANFLKRIGWHRGELWGREVTVPKDFDFSLASAFFLPSARLTPKDTHS
jgi:membrane-bound lytic murein transglycosylase B